MPSTALYLVEVLTHNVSCLDMPELACLQEPLHCEPADASKAGSTRCGVRSTSGLTALLGTIDAQFPKTRTCGKTCALDKLSQPLSLMLHEHRPDFGKPQWSGYTLPRARTPHLQGAPRRRPAAAPPSRCRRAALAPAAQLPPQQPPHMLAPPAVHKSCARLTCFVPTLLVLQTVFGVVHLHRSCPGKCLCSCKTTRLAESRAKANSSPQTVRLRDVRPKANYSIFDAGALTSMDAIREMHTLLLEQFHYTIYKGKPLPAGAHRWAGLPDTAAAAVHTPAEGMPAAGRVAVGKAAVGTVAAGTLAGAAQAAEGRAGA